MRKKALSQPLYTLFNRRRVLERLVKGTTDKRELVDETDLSRATVDRSIRALVEHGIIDERSYELTPYGRLLYESQRHFRQRIRTIHDARSIVTHAVVPRELPTALFSEATVVYPDRSRPQKPLSKLRELVTSGADVKILVPVISGESVRLVERANDCGDDVVIVIEESAETIFSTRHHEVYTAIVDSQTTVLKLSTRRIPVTLVLVEGERLGLCFYDERGREVGAVVSTAPRSLAWADELWSEYAQ